MSKESSKVNLIIAGIAIFAVSFGAGYFTKSAMSNNVKNSNFEQMQLGQDQGMQGGRGQANGTRNGQQGAVQGRNAFTPVTGEIISMDDKSVTVKLADGSSKIVLLSDITKYSKSSEVTKTDIKTGDTIGVFGQTNTDGSVSAQTIELNPNFNGRVTKD